MSTFITRLETRGSGIRVAVKDLIDTEGLPTTAGCRAVAEIAEAAPKDATCLAGVRAAGARIVGRTNLHELAFGVTGVNPWFGTPVNPLDAARVPGGSSSGSAVAVATDEADVAYGTDTGGSVRIPSACCGTAGLKTTWGRVPLEGVHPLAPSLDTVGPMARDVEGLVTGMALLEPAFRPTRVPSARVGRIRVGGDPIVEEAVDRALRATGWDVVDVDIDEWDQVTLAAGLLLVAEAWTTIGTLVEHNPDKVGRDVVERLRLGREVDGDAVVAARAVRDRWRERLDRLFDDVELLATPTLTALPPLLGDGEELLMARCTLPVNLAGVPALALPVPARAALPASLQLIAPAGAEDLLLAAGRVVEAARDD